MRKYLCFILLILFIPFIVLADAEGPHIIEYDAIIVNKNGVKYTDENGNEKIIPYNSKVRVIMETESDISVTYINEEKKEIFTSISKKDIIPYNDEINPNDSSIRKGNEGTLFKESGLVIVFNKNGIKLRKGPDEKWKEYDEIINYMTVLDTTFTMNGGSGPGGPSNLWFYVENNNYHGWINSRDVAYKIDDKLLTFADIKLKDETGKELITIPAETELDEVYKYEAKKQYYVKYNFEQGFISYDSLGYEITDYVLSKKDTVLQSIKGETRVKIPFGVKLEVLYADYEGWEFRTLTATKGYFYVKYNNQRGFIKESDVLIDNYSELNSKFISQSFKIINDVTLYDLSNKGKEILQINANNDITSPYCYIDTYDENDDFYQEEWCVIKYNNNIGKILTKQIKNDVLVINNTNQKDEDFKPREVRLENIFIEGYYDIGFNKRERQYTIKIKNEKQLNINVLKEIDTDKVEIIGNENLENGSIIRIIVTRGNESTKYFINITKDSFFKANHLIAYCIIIAIALGIMSFGIILFINKKKKNNKNTLNKVNNVNNKDDINKSVTVGEMEQKENNTQEKTIEIKKVNTEDKVKEEKITDQSKIANKTNKNSKNKYIPNSKNIKYYKNKRKNYKNN